MVIIYQTSFISINELKHCLNLRPGNHGFFFFLAFECLGKFVIPASFSHEFIPHMNLTLGRSMCHPETRLQNCCVIEAVVYVLDHKLVFNSEKGCAFFVKTFSQVHFIFERQFPFVMETDFVQHSAEIEQAAHFVVGTTKTQVSYTSTQFYKTPRICGKLVSSSSQTLARIFFSRNFSKILD